MTKHTTDCPCCLVRFVVSWPGALYELSSNGQMVRQQPPIDSCGPRNPANDQTGRPSDSGGSSGGCRPRPARCAATAPSFFICYVPECAHVHRRARNCVEMSRRRTAARVQRSIRAATRGGTLGGRPTAATRQAGHGGRTVSKRSGASGVERRSKAVAREGRWSGAQG